MFSGGVERGQWHEMVQKAAFVCYMKAYLLNIITTNRYFSPPAVLVNHITTDDITNSTFPSYENGSSRSEVFSKKSVLKNFPKLTGKHLSHMPQACNFIKNETLAQVFSCEFCEMF